MSASDDPLELILAHQIQRRAWEEGDRDVVTFENGDQPDELRTYRMLWDNGRRVAAALAGEGMARGDRFALLLQNHPEFIDAMVGSSVAGTVYVPIDPRTKGDKLLFMLKHSGCRGVVCAGYNLAHVLDILDRAPQLEWLWVLGDDVPAVPPRLRLRAFGELLRTEVADVAIQANDPADVMQIMYTSGTTGDPKGVVVRYARWGAVGGWSSFFGFRRDDRPYTGLSLTHGNAQLMTLASSLRLGMRAVLSRKFTKSRLWDIARKYGCTTFNLLGGMTTAIYSENPRPDDADNPVRFVISAGMPAAIWREFEQRFGVQVLEVYAAVEGGLTIKPIGVGPVGSIGKPPPGLEARIVDAAGRDVGPYEHGEIIFRPANGTAPVVDYFRNPEASAQKTAGGWLRMGDIGHFDQEGWLYFDYRVGGGIRHNGEFVNAAFVEKVIAASPLVSDVFVYGVPAASGAPGEKDVVAAVVLAPGTRFADARLFDLCRMELESSFVPSYFQVVDEIPKTASEKPLERVLLQEFSAAAANVFSQ
jgi:crotonobetaine/carnitine-CoA ligase